MMKKERETLLKMIGQLQHENTTLAARLSVGEKISAASDPSIASKLSGESGSREATEKPVVPGPVAGSPKLGDSASLSRDHIRSLIDEEHDVRTKKGRFRGFSVGSSRSDNGLTSRGTRSRASSRNQAEAK